MMSDWDEQLGYFVILSQLLREAGLQLAADAEAPATQLYAPDLDRLRAALGDATLAATAIISRVQMQRASSVEGPFGHTMALSRATH